MPRLVPSVVHRLVQLAVAAALLLPLAALPASLGKLAVLSKTGEPLNAEIDIVAIRADERDSLAASLASAEAFRAANVTPAPRLEIVRATVERAADGRYVLRLSSTEPVTQPLVDLLLELSWSGGRIQRQYTFLVTPGDAPPPGAPAASPLPKAAAPAPATPRAETVDDYKVQPGDTLAKIAQGTRAAGATVEQTMVAIFRANQGAFLDDNLNRLRAASVLAMPSPETAAALPADEAKRIVAEHRAAFDEYRRRLAGAVASAPASPAPARRREAGRVVAKPEPPAKRGDRLVLQGDPTGDDLAARDRALAAARERIGKLEQALNGLRQLIDARNQEVEALERQLAPKAR